MLADASNDVAVARAQRFEEALDSARFHQWEPTSAPSVLTDLDRLSSPLLDKAGGLRSLPWMENPRFAERSNECALVHLERCVDFDGVSAGLLLMTSESFYPEHTHPPSEMYLVVAGQAEWRFGGATEYVPVAPMTILMNEPNDVHGLRTSDEPVLALWVLFEDETN